MLDAVDDLRRDVDALRVEIAQRRAPLAPGAAVRVALERALLVAVATIAGAGHFRPLVIVSLMAAALVAVVVSEILASRAAYVPPRLALAQPRLQVIDPLSETPLGSDRWELSARARGRPATTP